MITRAKNYTNKKKNKNKNGQTDRRTNGKSKAIQTNHTQKHIYTHTQKEKKGKKYIYIIAPKVHLLNLG